MPRFGAGWTQPKPLENKLRKLRTLDDLRAPAPAVAQVWRELELDIATRQRRPAPAPSRPPGEGGMTGLTVDASGESNAPA